MKRPFSSLAMVRTPCRLGEARVIVTPGTGAPLASTTWPLMLPVWVPWATRATEPTTSIAAIRPKEVRLRCMCILLVGCGADSLKYWIRKVKVNLSQLTPVSLR